MPDGTRLEEEEKKKYQENGGEEGGEKKDGDATVAAPEPQSQVTDQPQLQTEQPLPTSTTTQAAPQSSGLQEGEEGAKREAKEEAKEEPPNECAELINDYDARVCEHCAALKEAISHVHQNAAPVVEKVHAWKEAAKALSRQMAEQVVRDEQLIQ